MLKRLLVVFFFLCLFAKPIHAQTATAQVNSQIVVSFRQGQSPKEITDTLAARDKNTSTLIGKIQYFVLEVAGKIPGRSYYTTQLDKIAQTERNAGITSSVYGYKFQNGNSAYYMTVQDGKNINNALKLIQTLPQVNFASKKVIMYPNGIQHVQSEDSNGSLAQQIIVQFKEGFTPDQVAQAVDQQAKIQSMPFGNLRVASEDGSSDINYQTILNSYSKVQTEAKLQDQNNYLNFQIKKPTPLQNALVITVQPGQSVQQAISAYKTLPQVEYAQKRPIVYPNKNPNDQYFSRQWNMQQIQAPAAWDITTGSSNVEVAVVDTGVDSSHPDLQGVVDVRAGSNQCTFNTCPGEPNTNPNNPSDDIGHGTHVSGIIGAVGNNTIGVTGVNWNVKIMAVKVMGPNGGDPNPGLEFAIQNGAKVINLSAGGCSAVVEADPTSEHCPEVPENRQIDQITKQTIDDVVNAGALLVLAAGNGNQDSIYTSPPNYNAVSPGKILVVAATGPSDIRASFSDYGSMVDISAPGSQIPSTMAPTSQIGQQYCQAGSYCYLSGTSMAAPHVAGAAALLLSVNPNLTLDQIRNALIQNADQISTDLPIGPRLNLAKAVAAVSGGQNPTPTPTDIITPTPTLPPDVTPTPTEAVTPNPTPTLPPDVTPTPTTEPTGEPTATPTTPPNATPTPTSAPSGPTINYSFILPGIGTGVGDNSSPAQDTPVELFFIDSNGNLKYDVLTTAQYANGVFSATRNLNSLQNMNGAVFEPGTYQIKIKTASTLIKLVPGFYTITQASNTILPVTTLSSGDINQDNTLDLLDYNVLISCIQESCAHNIFNLADFNSDGNVDAKDLNIFLRQLQTRVGD